MLIVNCQNNIKVSLLIFSEISLILLNSSSFNEDLDKEFIKDLSTKLYEWTNNRWIITLSKTKGEPSKKEKEINQKKELIEKAKNSLVYKSVLDKFPDAELIDLKVLKKDKKND